MWNPILYALLNLQLRAAFLQLVPQCFKDSMARLFGQKKHRFAQRASVEESRLLNTTPALRGAAPRQGSEESAKKWMTCFLNSSGSVESSTSDAPANAQEKQRQATAQNQVANDNKAMKWSKQLPKTTARNGGTADRRVATNRRTERYGSCLTELDEQTLLAVAATAAAAADQNGSAAMAAEGKAAENGGMARPEMEVLLDDGGIGEHEADENV